MPKGGRREGAGRKPNTGLYQEPTVARRIPKSLAERLDQFVVALKENQKEKKFVAGANMKQPGLLHVSQLALPFFSNRVQAGFPSPADDHLEASLDLNQHLVPHPAATFFVRASGTSMVNAGIIAALNSELTVKRLYAKDNRVALMPENPDFTVIEVGEEMDFLVWGVVTSVVHQIKETPR